MIKGVNKKVVEINNPRSIYFDRAVFYLKPNMSLMPEKLITREAEELIREFAPRESKKTAVWKVVTAVSLSLSAVCAAAAAFIICLK